MVRGGAKAESFWRFSLMVYSRPGVAAALIRLQDRGGHNANLVLFGLWLGMGEGARLDAAGLTRARAAMQRLDRDVVAPLRALRRALRDEDEPDIRDLRRRVLALELAAERRVQARLAASAAFCQRGEGEAAATAAANLRLILGNDFKATETALILRSAG